MIEDKKLEKIQISNTKDDTKVSMNLLSKFTDKDADMQPMDIEKKENDADSVIIPMNRLNLNSPDSLKPDELSRTLSFGVHQFSEGSMNMNKQTPIISKCRSKGELSSGMKTRSKNHTSKKPPLPI